MPYELNQWQKLFCPNPTANQWEFLDRCRVPESETMFGYGSAIGGTEMICMAALDGCREDGYCGMIFRKSFVDLMQAGGIVDRMKRIRGQSVRYIAREVRYDFSGEFGKSSLYLGHARDLTACHKFDGMNFNFIGIDCIQQINWDMYKKLRSRLRGQQESIGCTAHFSDHDDAAWIPGHFRSDLVSSRMDLNPGLDASEYRRSLMNVDPRLMHSLMNGEWYE